MCIHDVRDRYVRSHTQLHKSEVPVLNTGTQILTSAKHGTVEFDTRLRCWAEWEDTQMSPRRIEP